MSPWPNYSITIIPIGKLMQVTSSIKTLNSSTTKKCKCSFETQTRDANPHIPSSDKNQRVNIKDQCDRGKIRQKDRRQKRAHSVSSFCFVVFRPHSLLDFLESRVMKRKSINHCEERSEMERWTRTTQRTLKKSCKILHSVKDLGVGIGNDIE